MSDTQLDYINGKKLIQEVILFSYIEVANGLGYLDRFMLMGLEQCQRNIDTINGFIDSNEGAHHD